MRPTEWLLTAVLLLWWALSYAFQLHPTIRKRLQTLYQLGLVSGYRFFATPRNVDLHLETRTLDSAGTPTPWRPAIAPPARTWHSIIWNPAARTWSAYRFTALMLLSTLQHRGRAVACRSPAHRKLLAALTPSGATIQFRILRGNALVTTPALIFQSDWHADPQ